MALPAADPRRNSHPAKPGRGVTAADRLARRAVKHLDAALAALRALEDADTRRAPALDTFVVCDLHGAEWTLRHVRESLYCNSISAH